MSDVTRSIKEGVGFGLIAGAVFAAAETVVAIATGSPALMPFRMFASVLLGADALAVTPAATAFAVGLIAHLWLSTMYGLFYGIYNSALTMPTRKAHGRQAVIGLLFGAMLWLVNFQVFARFQYPWFFEMAQAPQLVLHAVFFGLPLGLLYATAERRGRPVQRAYSFL